MLLVACALDVDPDIEMYLCFYHKLLCFSLKYHTNDISLKNAYHLYSPNHINHW